MTRLAQSQLLVLDASLSETRRQLISAVAGLRLASGLQLRRLLYTNSAELTSDATARLARLDLAFLTDHRCLQRLDRRIGGARSGSAGYVYALGPVGRRLIDLWRGEGIAPPRSRYEPTIGFVDHALAVTETIVGLHEQLAHQPTSTLEYRTEPATWRNYLGPAGAAQHLKPDGEVIVRTSEFTDHWWLEVDRATERRSVIARKLGMYGDYFATGAEQARQAVFPLTAWLTTTETRAAVLRDEIGRRPQHEQDLFRVGLLDRASDVLLSGDAS